MILDRPNKIQFEMKLEEGNVVDGRWRDVLSYSPNLMTSKTIGLGGTQKFSIRNLLN